MDTTGAPAVEKSGGNLPLAPEAPVDLNASVGARADERALARIRRGEAVIRRHEARWRELWAHFDGDQYVERVTVASADQLVRVQTSEGPGKPRWRSRLVRNRFTKAIVGEVSVIASRVPTWEVTPINADRPRVNKARLGEKCLQALNQKLKIRTLTFRVAQVAAVTGDGYALPLWDPTIGDPVVDPEQGYTGKRTGDIRIKVLRQDQVMWQPHQAFEESRWYAVRDAQPVSDVIEAARAEGFAKAEEKLKADATTDATQYREGDAKNDLVFVYHYFERPSDRFPGGRYLQIAGGYVVCKPYEYPVRSDIPVLHRLEWIAREHRERSLGAGELAIDIQRSINRIVNQLIAWRNLVLNPQLLAPEGAIKSVVTEEPGIVIEYRPTAGMEPKWREAPDIPVSLFRDLEQAYADLDYVVGSGGQLPTGVESGQAIQGVNEREASYRAQIIANLAGWYSGLGEHLLELVRRHYTEERLLTVNGRFGVAMVKDFLGSDLDEYAGVAVKEASIVPRTRAEMEAKILAFADRGWISPAHAMSALQGGTAEAILDRFELDIAKAHRHIAQLLLIGDGDVDAELVPSASLMDDHAVQKDVLAQWMKTEDFEMQHEIVQVLALALYQQHEAMEAQALDTEAARVQMRSIANGQQNAARPAIGPGQASQPSMTSEAATLSGQQPSQAKVNEVKAA